MKYTIDFPPLMKDGVEYEPTGEYRRPSKGEYYLCHEVRRVACDFRIECYPILRPKFTPLQRLENLRNAYRGLPGVVEELDAILAAMKAEDK